MLCYCALMLSQSVTALCLPLFLAPHLILYFIFIEMYFVHLLAFFLHISINGRSLTVRIVAAACCGYARNEVNLVRFEFERAIVRFVAIYIYNCALISSIYFSSN